MITFRVRRRGFRRDVRKGDLVRWVNPQKVPPRLRRDMGDGLIMAMLCPDAVQTAFVQKRSAKWLILGRQP